MTAMPIEEFPPEAAARIARGEEIVVTRGGLPVAALAPLLRRRKDRTTAEIVERFRGLPRADWREMRRDIDEFLDSSL